MAQEFFTILTAIGRSKLANAVVTGVPLSLTHMAVGDGDNGAYYNPTESQTALKHEVARGAINHLYVDPNNPNWIVAEWVIPDETGGFYVRDVGVFDTTGDLIAVGKYPESYKPVLPSGSGKQLYVRMIMEVANTAVVTLKIDPSVVLATRKYADEAITASMAAHLAAADPHPQYLTEAEGNAKIAAAVAALVNSSPLALDTLAELATALNNDANFAATIASTLALKAPLDSAALTGTPTAPTPSAGDNSTKLATTAFANAAGGVVGNARNARMSSGTFTADEVIVQSSLGGSPVRLANVNKSINLATVGAGGMDTGAAPNSGYVGIYLIYNPTTQASALLATNATAAAVPEVYGGANMPAGYTHSALVAVWGTTAAGALIVATMLGRTVYFGAVQVFLNTGSVGAYSAAALTLAIPLNAKQWGGYASVTAITNATVISALTIAATVGGLGQRHFQIPGNGSSALATAVPFENMPIVTPQTVYYTTVNYNGNAVAANNYTF